MRIKGGIILAQIYSIMHQVAYYECDINQQMTLPSLIQVMITASEEQSDSLNRGSAFVNQLGLGWVITNYQLSIQRLPRLGETIRFSTKATAYNKFFCYRDFYIEDEQGNRLVTVESVFVLMDLVTRKIKTVDEQVIAPFESEKINRIKRFEKIPELTNPTSQPYRVRFYDLDGNQHVNNAIYFHWMLDVLDYEFLTKYQPTHVQIRFDKEIEYGNIVDSAYQVTVDANTQEVQSIHQMKVADQLCCEAVFTWQPMS